MPLTAKLIVLFCDGVVNLSVGLNAFSACAVGTCQIWKMHNSVRVIVVIPFRVVFLSSVGKVPLDRLQDLVRVWVITLCVSRRSAVVWETLVLAGLSVEKAWARSWF